ncbi:MAG: Na+/H+ antiporter NhaC family protein [Pseudomonadota bacterium]
MALNIRRTFGPAAWLLGLLVFLPLGPSAIAAEDRWTFDVPQVVLRGLPASLTVAPPSGTLVTNANLVVDGRRDPLLENSAVSITANTAGWQTLALEVDGRTVASARRYVLPGWLTILPPLIAFLLAIFLREVIPALFVAIWLGTFLVLGPSLTNLVPGLLQAASVYGVAAVTDEGHAMLIVFTLLVGGLVAVLSRSGGTQGIVNQIVSWADNRRRGQTATATMGLAIFFDDYANTLVLGKTMRPVTDALRISREKLAYLVDSTAAPVSTLAIISSWIGFQVGLIDEAIQPLADIEIRAYGVFINSLAYNFYPILTLLLVVLVATSGRDFGPMRRAEERAATTGELFGANARIGDSTELKALDPKAGVKPRAINAYLPLAVLVFGVIGALYFTGAREVGSDASLMTIIGASDSYVSMIWATLASLVVAIAMTVGQRLLSLAEAMEAWLVGAKTMLLALIVLVLAWALAGVNETLQTAEWLSATLGDQIDARWLPPIIFLLAAVTAIATGTSWGVMGILMPLVIPLVWKAATLQGVDDPMLILFASTSSVLAGAVVGDHCSPLADTSILTASSTSCDLIDHIKTQLPYALLTATIALGFGLIPAMYGLPWWLALVLSGAVLTGVFRWLTRDNTPL